MASVIITMKVMPEGVETDLDLIRGTAEEKIAAFGGKVGKVEIKPIAFGLKAVEIMFIMDEKLGGTDKLEAEIASTEGINSAEVTDVRRAIG